MTPKEKAQELFDKYYQIFEDDEDEHYIGTSKRISKLSALIAVDQIKFFHDSLFYVKENSLFDYYLNQVKHEIEQL